MGRLICLSICLALMFVKAAPGAGNRARFDGIRDTALSCSSAAGALGYSFQFPSTVKDGVLRGE